jgi:hypothetical protein
VGLRKTEGQRGAASVEQAGLAALIALLVITAVSAIVAGPPREGGRALGAAIARRIACAPRLPDACRHHPLVRAYGWPLARTVRALAPHPAAHLGPGALRLMPVDFRYCRRPSCAVPRPGAEGLHLTTSGRRITEFVSIEDLRRRGGYVELTYWLYRPALGWERIMRRATPADIAGAAGTAVLMRDDPALAPLETLPGRDQYRFPIGERPPWQWKLHSIYPG